MNAAAAVFLSMIWGALGADDNADVDREKVGRGDGGRLVTPTNQIVTPAGKQLDLPGLRPQVIALHPAGKILATAGKTSELIIIDPVSATIRQRVKLPTEGSPLDKLADKITGDAAFDDKGQVSFTGLIFSPDGSRIYLSNVNGSIKEFTIDADGAVKPSRSLPLPPANAPRRKEEIPSGLAIAPDGKTLYVCGNLSNRLIELDIETAKVKRTWDVGVAPYDVSLQGTKAFVSNWGGRRPDAKSVTGPAGQGTLVRVDPVRHIADEGSVSEIDLQANQVVREVVVGKHASGLALSKDGKHLAVANAGSDTVSVIEMATGEVIETIWTKQNASVLFGASPNALVFSPDGEELFVCNGTMNAVAVIEFEPGESKIEGLIPVGWFPGAITFDAARNSICVANIKGIGSGRPNEKTGRPEFNSHQYHGLISIVPRPSEKELASMTSTVLRHCRAPAIEASLLPPREGRKPVPIPERSGEPSLIEHVVYIIKENRTYDQVLGDIPEGNGDPDLCIFGEKITPNQHKMAREFVLLDNTYCSGILSADGHQWADTGFATDYMEKSFAGFPRSYPDGMEDSDIDALAYSPAGFIWDSVLAKKKTLRVYGEFAITDAKWKDADKKGKPSFLDYYRDFTNKTGLIDIKSRPAIETLRPHLCTSTVGWDMNIPDVFRAEQFIKELREFEKKGTLPNLIIICLPNDHTSGTKPGVPTPAAQVADNDLAFGQIAEAIGKSSFWKKTCIFAIEDDPQAGWDHVSGYRTTGYIISPYAKRKAVVSTQYNQTSILRTIGLILGLPPMNTMDAAATPMFDCFAETPDFTPFTSVPTNIPLDEMNPGTAEISHPVTRQYAEASAKLPLDEIDQCPEDLFNRILWHSQKGPDAPYPQWAITVVEDDD